MLYQAYVSGDLDQVTIQQSPLTRLASLKSVQKHLVRELQAVDLPNSLHWPLMKARKRNVAQFPTPTDAAPPNATGKWL